MTSNITNLVSVLGPLLISYHLPAYLKINFENFKSLHKISFFNTLVGSNLATVVILAQDPTPRQLNDRKYIIRIKIRFKDNSDIFSIKKFSVYKK
jgi:hypothetical protein